MSVVEVTNATFESEVLNSDKPVLVDFWASWCGPCKMLTPIIHQVADERADIKVCSVNVDDEPELAQQFQIASIPTLLVFRDGKLANRSLGFIQKDRVEALIAE